MSFNGARRLPGMVGALAAAVFMVPGAAHAASTDQVQLEASDVIVPTGSTSTGVAVRLHDDSDATVVLTHLKVVIDASGLAGVATVAAAYPDTGGKCDTSGTKTTCTYDQLDVSMNPYPAFLDVKAASGAVAGATGSYSVTAEADGLSRTATGKVTVAEGVNLVAGPEITLSGPAGSTLALSPTVRNAGSRDVHGAVLSSSTGSRSASYQPQYSNCVYNDAQFYCTFDQDLVAGRQYGLASPVAVRLAKDAPAPSTFDTYADWQTPDDDATYIASIREHGGKPGTGPALRLVDRTSSALRATVPQTDVSASDNFSHVVVDVTGQNLPDLAALGTTVRGKAGATVTTKIAIKNLGPAVIDDQNQFPSAYVVLPAGTTVAKLDHNCEAVEGKAGEYRCLSVGLTVGQTATWTLDLKIGATGTGKITARTVTAEEGVFGPDRNAANNTADLLINPPAGAGGGATGDGSDGTDGTGGGGLPITGPDVPLAAGAGIVLLLAGASAFVVARRRRTRYIA